MSTKYPNEIDTDAELPLVSDNITEVGAEAINALRSAIFAIQESIGTNPEGTTANLVNRLAESLNDDGTLKASALIAAGLVALPITNNQVGASAAIKESKLDLDVATQTLQDQVSDNDVDIAELQRAITDLIRKLNEHVNGLDFRHDSTHIDLATTLTSIVASDVDAALVAINNRFLSHISSSTLGAHPASSVSVDTSNFVTINQNSTNTQAALEDLDQSRNIIIEQHQDNLHANGFSNWANDVDGYSIYNKKFPLGAQSPLGFVVSGTRDVFEFDGYALEGLNIVQGDVLVINEGALAGNYVINDVGPRDSLGSKPSLLTDQLEIVGTFLDGYATTSFNAAIFKQSSLNNLKATSAATIHQSDVYVDSIQVARPNSAKVVSLGFNADLIDSSSTLAIEVGVDVGLTRQITIDNLNFNRFSVLAPEVTLNTVVERINHILHNRTDGYAFPVSAYALGDELMLSHNWDDKESYLKVLGSGTGNFELGFDGYGADVVDRSIYSTQANYFYVNGKRHTRYKNILTTTADITSQTFTMPAGVNPLSAGVKIGHLLHLKTHANTDELGTYFVTAVTSNSITIDKNAGITTENGVLIEIRHDAAPLNEYNSNTRDQLVEIFLASDGSIGYNERLRYQDNIGNLKVVDVSDNFAPAETSLVVSSSGASITLQLGGGESKTIPNTFSGQLKLYFDSNIEFIVVDLTSVVGDGTNDIVINNHIDEEEFLEICTVLLDGAVTLSDIKDKRLFGTTGLDEIREDYTQAFVESYWGDLRSSGIIRGFDILEDGYVDLSIYPSNQSLLVNGGVALVDGARLDIPTTNVPVPNESGTFVIALNSNGTFKNYSSSEYSLEELIDGYAGALAPIVTYTHDGSVITSFSDLRFFINDLDDKVDLVVDLTNRRVGSFDSIDAALNWIESYPHDEKFKLRLASNTNDDIVVRNINRELTIQLDGSVRSLTLNNPCNLISESLANRGRAHVTGGVIVNQDCDNLVVDGLHLAALLFNLNSEGRYLIQNCYFDGYQENDGYITDLSGATYDKISIKDTLFAEDASGIDITSTGHLEVDGCEFVAGSSRRELILSGGDVSVFNSTFENTAITSSSPSKFVLKDSKVMDFEADSSLSAIEVDGDNVFVTGVEFNNLSDTGSSVDIINLSSATDVAIKDSLFKGCSVSGSNVLVNVEGVITNTVFDGNTWNSSQNVIANTFTDNKVIASTNSSMNIAAEYVRGNIGLMEVSGIGTSEPLRIVSDNQFVFTSTGTSIDLSTLQNNDAAVISGNNINVGGDTGLVNCIVYPTTSAHVTVSGNVLRGTADDNLISIGNFTGESIISDNRFLSGEAILMSSQCSNFVITNNVFDAAVCNLQFSSNAQILGNNFLGGLTTTINGGTGITNLIVSENIFSATSSFTISSNTLSDSSIVGNEFTTLNLNIGTSVSGLEFSKNKGSVVTAAPFTATEMIFTENSISYSSIDEITLDNSLIQNNIFLHDANTTFTINSTLGGVDANVFIENNLFAVGSSSSRSLRINALNPVQKVFVNGNASGSTGSFSGILTLVALNNSSLNDNIFPAINIDAGSNSTTISGNICSSNLNLGGSCNSTLVEGNNLAGIIVECDSTGKLQILNNFINGDFLIEKDSDQSIDQMIANNNTINGKLDIFGTDVFDYDGYRTMTNSSFANNTVAEDLLVIGDVNTSNSFYTMTDVKFVNNFMLDDVIVINNGVSSTPDNLSYTFERILFSGNTVRDNFMVFSSSTTFNSSAFDYYDDLTFNDVKISGNEIGNTLRIAFARQTESGIMPTVNDLTVDNNNIIGDVLLGQQGNFNNFRFSGNKVGGTSTWSCDSLNTIANCTVINSSISENDFGSDFVFDKTNFVSNTQASSYTFDVVKIQNNSFNSNSLLFDRTEGTTGSRCLLIFEKLLISGNDLRSIQMLSVGEGLGLGSDFVIDGGVISNNFFNLDTSGGGAFSGILVNSNVTSGIRFAQILISSNSTNNVFDIGTFGQPRFEVYGDDADDDIAVNNLKFTNNSFIDFIIDDISLAGHDVTLEKIQISGNTMGECSVRSTAGNVSEIIISNNVIENSNEERALQISSLGSMTNVTVTNNSIKSFATTVSSVIAQMTLSSVGNITNLSISNNLFDLFDETTAILVSGDASDNIKVDGNIIRAVSVVDQDPLVEVMLGAIDNISISNNIISISGESEGIELVGTLLDRATISNNKIEVTTRATTDNNLIRVATTSSTSDLDISYNHLVAPVSSYGIHLNDITSVSRLTMTYNTLKVNAGIGTNTNSIYLPDQSDFNTGSYGQSFIVGNMADAWISTGTINSTTDDSIFPWMNVQRVNSTGVTFAGSTNRTVANTNGIGAGGDTDLSS